MNELRQESESGIHLLQVVKNRFSGDLGLTPLFFNKGTLTFSKKTFLKEKNAEKAKKKEQEEEQQHQETLIRKQKSDSQKQP